MSNNDTTTAAADDDEASIASSEAAACATTISAAAAIDYSVHRQVVNCAEFDDMHRRRLVSTSSHDCSSASNPGKKLSASATMKHLLLGWLTPPLVGVLRSGGYAATDLVSDTIAGFTACVFHIPQGLAYGLLAGLKPVNGLYTSLIPVFIFAVFGRSRHLSIGTFAVMSLLLSDMILGNYEAYLPKIEASNVTVPMNFTDVEYAKLQTAIVGSFAASVILIAIGLFRLGFFMRYMSDAMLKGFTTAAGVHVLMSQLSLIFGVKIPRTNSRFKIIGTLINLSKVISSTNFVTLGLSAACCAVLYLVKRFVSPLVQKKSKVPLPIELIVIVITLLASKFADMNARFSVDIVGDVPRGLPSPLVPDLGFLPTVLPSAIPVGIVGGAITMSLAKLYCLQFQYNYDFNEDFVILGVSSLAGSFFQCFFACGALARNSVVVSVGMKSQLSSIISSICMLLVLLAVGPLLHSVPTCVLGSIIVVSLINVLTQVTELPQIWRISRIDFSVWLVAAGAVLLLDVTLGLAIGFGFTLFSVVLRTQNRRIAIMGQVADTDIYKNILVYSAAKELPGLKIVRFDAPLNFANAERFRDFVLKLAARLRSNGAAGSDGDESVHTIILDCSSWVYADMVGVRAVKETHQALKRLGYRVAFAACKESVRSAVCLLQQPGSANLAQSDQSLFFPSLHDAALFSSNCPPPTMTDEAAKPAAGGATKFMDELHAAEAVELVAGGVLAAADSSDRGDCNKSLL